MQGLLYVWLGTPLQIKLSQNEREMIQRRIRSSSEKSRPVKFLCILTIIGNTSSNKAQIQNKKLQKLR
jgi:hypothetical protein